MIEYFGRKAVDTITGFPGRLIGFSQYITGCNQVLLSPEISKDGSFRESCWFDESRIRLLPGKAIILDEIKAEKNPGPDRMAPLK
jgi:hypothetical protein